MAKFTINLPDAYNEALTELSEEIGLSKSGMGAQLISKCLEKRYPNRFPAAPHVPELSPGNTADLRIDEYMSDLLTLALNLNEGAMGRDAFIAQALKGHFVRWRKDYASRVEYFAKKRLLSWEQSYVLMTTREAPYDSADIIWAKTQPTLLTKEGFLGTEPALESGKTPAVVELPKDKNAEGQ